MRDIALVIIIVGSLPYILRRPWVGILMFSWVSYMSPHRLTWGFAFDLPFAAVTGAATLLALAFTSDRKAIPLNSLTVVWFLFLLHISITTVFAFNGSDAFDQWTQVIKIQVMVAATILLITTRQRFDALIWVITVSVGFYGVKGGIFSLLNNLQYRVWGPPGGFFEGNNELALALIMVIPLMRYLMLTNDNKWIRRLLLVSMGLCAVSIIGSYSRGAFLAGSVMALSLAWQSRYRISLLTTICVAALVAGPFLPDRWTDRMQTIQTYEQDGSAMGRINSWHFATNLAKDRPLTGGGFDTFTPNLFRLYAPEPDDFHDSHSIYFGTLGEHGFVGLALFVLIGALSLKKAGRVRKLCRKNDDMKWARDASSMLRISIIGFATGGLFLGLQYFDLYYHLVGLTVILERIVSHNLGLVAAENSDAGEAPATERRIGAQTGVRGAASRSRL